MVSRTQRQKTLSWSSNDKNTFALPVRGAYVKFEPEESGTLIVYVLQNGLTDAQEQDTKIGDRYKLRRRAMYILDEAGNNVALTTDDEWAGMGELSDLASTAGTSSTTTDKSNWATTPRVSSAAHGTSCSMPPVTTRMRCSATAHGNHSARKIRRQRCLPSRLRGRMLK